MEISGKNLAKELQEELKREIENLQERNVIPKLAIVTLGDESSWKTYVFQKIKLGKKLGVETKLINLSGKSEEELLEVINELNNDSSVHGIIIQRPMPAIFNKEIVRNLISFEKDVDGFRTDSKFEIPTWLAVKQIITQALQVTMASKLQNSLLNQSILILGKGETAGTPVINGLRRLGLSPIVVDSKTENKSAKLREADIIISAVGKKRVVEGKDLKPGCILIGIGIQREDGKLIGDYDVEDIKNIVSYYTPTPGGVGPLNLSYLFKNLITAAKKSKKQ